MKKISLLLAFCIPLTMVAQKQSFDLAAYTPPAGWVKQQGENAVQFTKEDAEKGAYCLITLFKAVPATQDPKENFDMAWASLVNEQVTVAVPPEMQPTEKENGWEIISGYAPFEKEGAKGVVVLVTASGFGKMINALILTNSDLYEKDISGFLSSISLAKPAPGVTGNATTNVTMDSGATPVRNGFSFTTTNFDDGWTSIVKEDWVEVSKGKSKVLIHYPNKVADAYNSVLMDALKNAWDVLVAPRYSTASNFEFKPLTGWQPIEFGEADAVERSTGKKVHVVLFKMSYSNGSGKYLEFITADKKTFEQEFCAYHESTSGWERVENMATYNKFAVAPSDLTGKWTNNFTGAIQYVNAYTGLDAGMNTHASNENFLFGTGHSYKWDLGVASGAVGNIKFQSAKSSGTFTMNGNWNIRFSDIEGKPRNYDVYFSCIKGLRILWINNSPFAKIE